MAFDSNVLRMRLAASNETADSITATAQWILFYKRHADEIARQWAAAVAADRNKLAEIYIANEVVQQSKIKRRGEFVAAFGGVLPGALTAACAQTDAATRDRIARVVAVWKDRMVFSDEDTQRIEAAVGGGGSGNSGNSSTSSSTSPASQAVTPPADLAPLITEYTRLLTADAASLPGAKAAVLRTLRALIETVEKIDQGETLAARQDGGYKQQQKTAGEEAEAEAGEEEDVYTAQDAAHSQYRDDDGYGDAEMDEGDDGYGDGDGDGNGSSGSGSGAKVGAVDPKLASFLASLSNK